MYRQLTRLSGELQQHHAQLETRLQEELAGATADRLPLLLASLLLIGLFFFALGGGLKLEAMSVPGALLAGGAFLGMMSASKARERRMDEVRARYRPQLEETTGQQERVRGRLQVLQAELDNRADKAGN